MLWDKILRMFGKSLAIYFKNGKAANWALFISNENEKKILRIIENFDEKAQYLL